MDKICTQWLDEFASKYGIQEEESTYPSKRKRSDEPGVPAPKNMKKAVIFSGDGNLGHNASNYLSNKFKAREWINRTYE